MPPELPVTRSLVAQQVQGGHRNRDAGERGLRHEGGRKLIQSGVPGNMVPPWKTADTPQETLPIPCIDKNNKGLYFWL